MPTNEIFDSSLRSLGDLAGVFEYDGDVGYFYLYRPGAGERGDILDKVHIISGETDFGAADIEIRWDISELNVGFLIRGVLWAGFDVSRGLKYGGGYQLGAMPALP